MANFTISIPDTLLPHVTAIMQADLSAPGSSNTQTGKALLAAWIRRQLTPKLTARYKRLNVNTAGATAARVAAESALATELAAQKSTEAAQATNASSDLAGVS